MPGTPSLSLHPAQQQARDQLAGLISAKNVGGRTLTCLIGQQGAGKTTLAKAICNDPVFAPAKRVAVNELLLTNLSDHYPDLLNFAAQEFSTEIKRFGGSLKKEVYQIVRNQMLDEGLTILDHLELVFLLGINPVTTWYNDAVGKRRVLLVLTGRMSGQLCQIGYQTLTRADQSIVELEAIA